MNLTRIFSLGSATLPLWLFLLSNVASQAIPPAPGSPPPYIESWSFNDTNSWINDFGYGPVAYSNVVSSLLGDYTALVVDSTSNAWIRYRVVEGDGHTNLTMNVGSVVMWFAPKWASANQGGAGPGNYGRLIEVGSYTTNSSYGWWSVYLDPGGTNVWFSGQTNNGSGATYLYYPISWTSNYWHQIALTYTATNSRLYLDGTFVASGVGVTYWPNQAVAGGGLFLGSDNSGTIQSHGMIDDVATYNYVLDAGTINGDYFSSFVYFYGNLLNKANFSQAGSAPAVNQNYQVISGPGFLNPQSTNLSGCFENLNVWLTNVSAVIGATGAVDVTFTIMGGSNNVPYDLFANTILGPTTSTNYQWVWMGQGYHCVTYKVPNLASSTAFLILGKPDDSDLDGLTDAYENLVSHTDPHTTSTGNDGIPDGWKVLWGITPANTNIGSQDPDSDALSNWQEYLWGTRPLVNEGNGIWVGSPAAFSGIP